MVVATNQSGVARGLFDMDTLCAIHDRMVREVNQAGGRIDAIFFCPHVDEDECRCRKPRDGMLREIAARYGVALNGVPAIGDGLRDIEAAVAAGAQPLLVLTGKGEQTRLDPRLPAQTRIFRDLAAAADALTDAVEGSGIRTG